MNKFYLLLFLFGVLTNSKAQQNMTLLSNFDFGEDANDIWGYEAPDGTEYALIGLNGGLGIMDLSDPATPLLRDYIPGASSVWRDIKTWGEYIYVVADEGSDGLLVVDMSNHDQPVALNFQYLRPELTINGITDTLNRAHNIYIDENGVAYIAGSNLNDGGMLFFDVDVTSGVPNFLGPGPAVYSHDVFVRGDTMYSSDIYFGYFSVVDVSDKMNPVILSTQNTPFLFSHNTWLSDDGNTLYTTDELEDAPVGAYDISDLSDITKLDEFRPPATIGQGVIPHNVHVKGDYLVISHYTDGVVIVDATDPSNLVQVGQYDTYTGFGQGFEGCWGAYPFFQSGKVLASDINTGLYVFDVNYVRAAYLRGVVTDASNGNLLNDVKVVLNGADITEYTDINGDYSTGLAESATLTATFSKSTYESKTINVSVTSGQVTMEDVQLIPLIPFTMTGKVIDGSTGLPVTNSKVNINNPDLNYDAVTDMNGDFNMPMFYEGEFSVYGGKWTYKTTELTGNAFDATTNYIEIELEKGIEDPFALDLGWTISGDATNGVWELGRPIAVQAPVPATDIFNDAGVNAYLTGIDPDLIMSNVSGGTTRLTSPVFDLTTYQDPWVRYYSYFFSVYFDGYNFPPPAGDDSLRVYLSNGTDEVLLETFTEFDFPSSWLNSGFRVLDHITPTSTMQISFETADLPSTSNDITMAGIDYFRVTEEATTDVTNVFDEQPDFTVFPNPFSKETLISLDESMKDKAYTLEVYNNLGQRVFEQQVNNQNNLISVGNTLDAGVYFVKLVSDDDELGTVRVVKVK